MGLAERWDAGSDAAHEPILVLEAPFEPVTARARFGRVVEAALAALILLLAAPIVLIAMAVVAASDGAPIFFGHERVGRGGVLFKCWKLRTMRADAERRLWADSELHRRYVENDYKLSTAEDPRLIRGGALLRRTYLDELPQLWNVIRGDMSLVGPRPIVPPELELFGADAPRLLRVRPGVFGEWTARGRERPPYPERVRVEMQYVDDPSFSRALRILAMSVGVVVRGQEDEA